MGKFENMKKSLLFTTALCAVSLCFGGEAKAERLIVTQDTVITENVIGNAAPETSPETVEGKIAWGTSVGTFAGDNGIRGGAIVNFKSGGGQTVTIANGIQVKNNKALGHKTADTPAGKVVAGIGGAIINFHGNTLNVGNNVSFSGNQAKDAGGAIWSEGKGGVGTSLSVGNGVSFTNNTATNVYGGAVGIIGQHGNNATFGDNVTFENNTSGMMGGAVLALRVNDNDAEELEITFGDNATFKGNESSQGGAVWNNGATVIFGENALFEGNKATKENASNLGAAVLNAGAEMTFGNGARFINNIAGTNNGRGGAIYNHVGGTLTFGDVVFSGNKANDVLNDISNKGVINFNGDVTLDGGITGNDAGTTVNFARGTTLTATLETTTIEAETVNFAGDNTLKLTVANGMANADYDFITAENLNGRENVTIADNAIYNLALTGEGKINVTVKSAQEIIENIDVPVQAQEAQTLAAVISTNGNGTDVVNTIADRIAEAMQNGNSAAAVQAVKDLAPTTSQQVMGVAQGVNNMLSNVTGSRMAAVSGRAGGDTFIGGSAWAQGLYNYTKQHKSSVNAGFEADSTGVAMGVDGKINDAVTIGFGYGFTRTDADSVGRDVDIDGHNFFIYGSYQPDAWYIDTMLSYGHGDYTEKKAPMGVAMTAKYHVNTFAANIMTGYAFDSGITPEGGLRYVLADQETYNDGAQKIATKDSDVLTAVLGVKLAESIQADDWTINPNFRLAATYDLISDNSRANIDIVGGSTYQITGKRLARFGGEAGFGLTAAHGKWSLSLEYNAGFRQDYQSHTGTVKVQYNF